MLRANHSKLEIKKVYIGKCIAFVFKELIYIILDIDLFSLY